jgi:hypothetical protein
MVLNTVFVLPEPFVLILNIVGEVVKREGPFEAVRYEGQSLGVPFEREPHWVGKRLVDCHRPVWESVSTKSAREQVLMRVKKNVNIVFFSISHNFFQNFHVCAVNFVLFRLESLERGVQSNHIEAPRSQILEVFVAEGEVRVERF